MKALVLRSCGLGSTPDAIWDMAAVDDVLPPTPSSEDVLVRVRAVGLNPVDYKLATSGFPSWTYPFVLGLDVSGEVAAVGSAVPATCCGGGGLRVGDAVLYHGDLSRPGGHAQLAAVDWRAVARKPPALSHTDAAALPCAGLTAYQALHRRLHVRPGDTVLVLGAAGGVGSFAVQLAAAAGCVVLATCSGANAEFVRSLGAAHAIDYTACPDLGAEVRRLTGGRGVDHAVDTVGPESATAALSMLAFGGGLACVSGLPDFGVIKPFALAPSIHEIALGGAHLARDAKGMEDLGRMAAELVQLVEQGKVKANVQEVIDLEGIPQALKRIAARHVRGKIVAVVNQP